MVVGEPEARVRRHDDPEQPAAQQRGRRTAALVGVFGVVIAISIGVVIAVTRGRQQPKQAVATPRVVYEVPARDAALWFVARYPDYFTSGERGLGTWLESLPLEERTFVVAMGHTLLWDWVEHESQTIGDGRLESRSLAAIVALRAKTLNQLDIDIGELEIGLFADRDDPHFGDGVFARLVRGASNCDGQNHLLELLLNTGPDIAHLVGLPSGHKVVRVIGRDLVQPVFVDAWSNVPPFVLSSTLRSPISMVAREGATPKPVVPGLPGWPLESVENYSAAGGRAIDLATERDTPRQGAPLAIEPPPMDRVSLDAIEDPWQLYLFARVLQLYDDPRAGELYRRAIEVCRDSSSATAFMSEASSLLTERLPDTAPSG